MVSSPLLTSLMMVPSLAQVLAGRPWAQHQERLNLTLGSQEQVGSPTLLAFPIYCHSTVIVSFSPFHPACRAFSASLCCPRFSPSVSLVGRAFRTSPVARRDPVTTWARWLSRAWGGGRQKQTGPQKSPTPGHPRVDSPAFCPGPD